jgi:hypothetical protein
MPVYEQIWTRFNTVNPKGYKSCQEAKLVVRAAGMSIGRVDQ